MATLQLKTALSTACSLLLLASSACALADTDRLVLRLSTELAHWPEAPATVSIATAPTVLDADLLNYNTALEALQQGHAEFAESALQDVLLRRKNDPSVLGAIGLTLLQRERYDEAARQFEQAARQSHRDAPTWMALAKRVRFRASLQQADTLLDDGRIAEAEKAVHQALAIHNNDADALTLLANVRLAEHHPDEAEKRYRDVLAAAPDNRNALRGIISLLAQSGRFEEASDFIARLDEELAQGKQAPHASLLGAVLRQASVSALQGHRTGSALKSLEMAQRFMPDDAALRYDLAQLYLTLRLPDLAKQVMQEGLDRYPQADGMQQAYATISRTLDRSDAPQQTAVTTNSTWVAETADDLPLAQQVALAIQLNAQKKDDELADFLPSLSVRIEREGGAQQARYRQTLVIIENEMARRAFDAMITAGRFQQAQKLAQHISHAAAKPPATVTLPPAAVLEDIKSEHPDDLQVRIDLASAYFGDGQKLQARHELNAVLGMLSADQWEMRLTVAQLLSRHLDDTPPEEEQAALQQPRQPLEKINLPPPGMTLN